MSQMLKYIENKFKDRRTDLPMFLFGWPHLPIEQRIEEGTVMISVSVEIEWWIEGGYNYQLVAAYLTLGGSIVQPCRTLNQL